VPSLLERSISKRYAAVDCACPRESLMASTSYTLLQKQTFNQATQVSYQVGGPTAMALGHIKEALSFLTNGLNEMSSTKRTLDSVLGKLDIGLAVARFLGPVGLTAAYSINASTPVRLAREAQDLLGTYKSSLSSIRALTGAIERRIAQKTFTYRSGALRFEVRSCRDLRTFSQQSSNVPEYIWAVKTDLTKLRSQLRFYASNEGRRVRNRTKQLMTDVKLYVNTMVAKITKIMRSGAAIRTIRLFIDGLNDNQGENACAGNRRGDSGDYSRCFGLNAAEPLLKYTAAKQGLSWNRYRDKWMGSGRYFTSGGLSNSDKERNIVTAFSEVRSLMKNIRDRQIPQARAEFVKAFAGMKDAVNKRTSDFTQAQRAQFGQVTLGALRLTDASVQLTQAYFDAYQAEPTLTLINNPANVQCQSGSGYAGVFGSGDGEPMNPLFVLGGGFAAGVALAHFMPALRER